MLLGEAVSMIVGTSFQMDLKLALTDMMVADSMEAHGNGFGAALLDGVVDDVFGAGVVRLDGDCGLWPPHFDESGAEHACALKN